MCGMTYLSDFIVLLVVYVWVSETAGQSWRTLWVLYNKEKKRKNIAWKQQDDKQKKKGKNIA